VHDQHVDQFVEQLQHAEVDFVEEPPDLASHCGVTSWVMSLLLLGLLLFARAQSVLEFEGALVLVELGHLSELKSVLGPLGL
jgi:hypothetical protein